MRLSIVKKQHQQLLKEIAESLRSDDPKDALEHILNCWLSSCISQQGSGQSTPTSHLPDSTNSVTEMNAVATTQNSSPELDDLATIATWD